MTKILGKSLKEYWYIDEKGILSLVSQCNEYLEEEKASQQSTSKERKAKLHLAIKALAAIFGSANAETDIEQNIANRHQDSIKYIKRTEQHLENVIKYLLDNNQLTEISNIDQLIDLDQDMLPLFCVARINFLLDKVYYFEKNPHVSLLPNNNISSQIVELILKEKFILFKADIGQCKSISSKRQRVVLGASLEKWLAARIDSNGSPYIGRTSHLSGILRESVTSPINIKFFGHVTKMGTSLYIKPYAIWDVC